MEINFCGGDRRLKGGSRGAGVGVGIAKKFCLFE